MFALWFFIELFSVVHAGELHDLMTKFRSNTSTWMTGVPEQFANYTIEDFKQMCGMFAPDDPRYRNPLSEHPTLVAATDIPTSFDARKQWPKCASVIGNIRDQSKCGSCWAFGTTEAFNDRLCIKTGNTALLSPDDTTACCRAGGCDGCGGGNPPSVWKWFETSGVCTGGNYDDIGKGDSCIPYSLPPCAHHENSSKYPDCPNMGYPTPKCKQKCESGYKKTYNNDKTKASSSYTVTGVERIQTEIMTNGPVTGGFQVFEDFLIYRTGVYAHYVFARFLAMHAIKIIGWGTDPHPWPCVSISPSVTDGWCLWECTMAYPLNCDPKLCKCDSIGETQKPMDYWLVVNSWNEDWGDNGVFKIQRGTNEAEIESHVCAGMP